VKGSGVGEERRTGLGSCLNSGYVSAARAWSMAHKRHVHGRDWE
jgi:hypothetical protein